MVAGVCSGVNTMFAMVMPGALIVAYRRHSLVHGILLLGAGVRIARQINSLRMIGYFLPVIFRS